MNHPQQGYGSESLARMPLGIVPVEADGSVYFNAPVAKELYFQLLDERGLAVRSMRSATYVHAGERMYCVGCHEARKSTPQIQKEIPLALRKAPADLQPEVSDGAIPFNWYRLAKPVLDAKCASCHAKEKKGPDMTYESLAKYVFYYPFWRGGFVNGEVASSGSRTVPGRFGAMASTLLKHLDKSHHDVSLTPEEFRRITLWLDCNGNELGAYTKVEEQRHGQIVWPEIDVDPKNPLGIEKTTKGP
jgi:cytochrome c553